VKAWLSFILFGALITAQLWFCASVLHADIGELIVVACLTIAAGASLYYDLLGK
jgi:hypothetical protein